MNAGRNVDAFDLVLRESHLHRDLHGQLGNLLRVDGGIVIPLVQQSRDLLERLSRLGLELDVPPKRYVNERQREEGE